MTLFGWRALNLMRHTGLILQRTGLLPLYLCPVKLAPGLASGVRQHFGFRSCGKKPELLRIDTAKNAISATLPIPPAGPEGGITASEDSVWLVTDKNGTLNRIDPSTNSARQKISIPPGSYNPIFQRWHCLDHRSRERRSDCRGCHYWQSSGVGTCGAGASVPDCWRRFCLDVEPRETEPSAGLMRRAV